MKNGLKIYQKEIFNYNKQCSIQNQQKKQEKNLKEVLLKKKDLPLKKRWNYFMKKVLDDLLINQEKLTKTERVKLFVTLSGYLFPKNKPVKEKIKEMPPFQISDYITFTSGDKPKE